MFVNARGEANALARARPRSRNDRSLIRSIKYRRARERTAVTIEAARQFDRSRIFDESCAI